MFTELIGRLESFYSFEVSRASMQLVSCYRAGPVGRRAGMCLPGKPSQRQQSSSTPC